MTGGRANYATTVISILTPVLALRHEDWPGWGVGIIVQSWKNGTVMSTELIGEVLHPDCCRVDLLSVEARICLSLVTCSAVRYG